MKKYLSVLGLYARQTFLPILGILLLMCGVEWFFFHLSLRDALTAYFADVGNGFPQPEILLPRGAAYAYFAAGFILIIALLCLCGCQFRAKTVYTLRRLSVDERTLFYLQWLYNALIFLLLWLTQTVLAFGLCRYYLAAAPEAAVGGQTLFLAWWRSEFLHSLLPQSDVALWIRNALMLVSLSLAAAIFPYKQRRGKYSGSAVAMIPYVLITFERGIGEWSHVGIAVTATAIVMCEWIGALLLSDGDEDEGYWEEVSEDA